MTTIGETWSRLAQGMVCRQCRSGYCGYCDLKGKPRSGRGIFSNQRRFPELEAIILASVIRGGKREHLEDPGIYIYIYIPAGRLVRRRLTCIFGGWGGGGCNNVLSPVARFFLAVNVTLSLCFQGGDATLSYCFQGGNATLSYCFQGGNATLSYCFQGGYATLSLCFQGGNATSSYCFQGGNATLSLCFQGGDATLSLCFQGGNATLSYCFQGGDATLSLCFQGGDATLSLCFQGGNATLSLCFQEYRQACSIGTVRTIPAECYDETKVPWLP